jgi:hypothetical protein
MESPTTNERDTRYNHDPALLVRFSRKTHDEDAADSLTKRGVIRSIERMLGDGRRQLINQGIVGIHGDSAKLLTKSREREATGKVGSRHIQGASTLKVHENHTPHWSAGIRMMP